MRKKELNLVILLSLIIAVFSLSSIITIFRKEANVIIEEYDEELYSLSISVDRNLVQKIDELFSELHFVIEKEEYRKLENRMKETGDCEEIIKFFKESHLFKKEALEGVYCEGKKPYFSVNQSDDLTHSYSFLPNNDGDNVFVCKDETGKYSIAFQEISRYSNLNYYILLDLNHFYDTIIPLELQETHWVVFMECDSGLCLQNHDNQDPWMVLSYEEMQARDDGYSIISRNQKNGLIAAETYMYPNYYGEMVHERIITIPEKNTANRVLTIGISRDCEKLYQEVNKDFYLTVLICFCFVICGLQIYRYARTYVQKSLDEQRELEVKHERERMLAELKQAQMQNSVSQLQPHFLYNTLSSIREIVLENPEEGAALIYDFTNYLRACLKAMNSQELISFEQELKNIEAYTNIEKMRLGEKLSIVYETAENNFSLIPLGIQPLVENAIRHGISKKRDKTGTVWIRSYKDADCYVIEVEDDGIGFDQAQTKAQIDSNEKDSTGLRNLTRRFKEVLNADVEIHSQIGVGTKVKVKIPM